MSTKYTQMNDSLHRYLLDNWLRLDPLQQQLIDETSLLEVARMQISPEQGQLMTLLVKLTGANKIIEVGTFTGYSAMVMAQALPANGCITCCDISQEWTSIAKKFWREAGVDNKIRLMIGPAGQTLDRILQSETGSYDLAFIDADKENYRLYYEQCLALLKPGGLIMLDNVFWGGSVTDSQIKDVDTIAIRQINQFIHQDSRVDIAIVPIGDGLSLARKKIDAHTHAS